MVTVGCGPNLTAPVRFCFLLVISPLKVNIFATEVDIILFVVANKFAHTLIGGVKYAPHPTKTICPTSGKLRSECQHHTFLLCGVTAPNNFDYPCLLNH